MAQKHSGFEARGYIGMGYHNIYRVSEIDSFKARGKINFNFYRIWNPYNQSDATLSGTPVIIEVEINSNLYYFKAYPTKT